jgi:hypothetical protein
VCKKKATLTISADKDVEREDAAQVVTAKVRSGVGLYYYYFLAFFKLKNKPV